MLFFNSYIPNEDSASLKPLNHSIKFREYSTFSPVGKFSITLESLSGAKSDFPVKNFAFTVFSFIFSEKQPKRDAGLSVQVDSARLPTLYPLIQDRKNTELVNTM